MHLLADTYLSVHISFSKYSNVCKITCILPFNDPLRLNVCNSTQIIIYREQVNEHKLESRTTDPNETFSLDHGSTESGHQASENDETTAGDEEENKSNNAQMGEIVLSSNHDTEVVLIPVRDIKNIAEKERLEE